MRALPRNAILKWRLIHLALRRAAKGATVITIFVILGLMLLIVALKLVVASNYKASPTFTKTQEAHYLHRYQGHCIYRNDAGHHAYEYKSRVSMVSLYLIYRTS